MSDTYTKLRQRLEEFAIPCIPGKGILEFLRIILTEKEAELLSKFRSYSRFLTIEEFARENGYNSKAIRESFYKLARRNLIRYERRAGKDYFCIQPLVVGLYEAFFSTWLEQNPDTLIPAARAMKEYFNDAFYKAASNSKSPWARVIPASGAIEATITENPEYYDIDETGITLIDHFRRLRALIRYGARNLMRKVSLGRMSEAINSLKSDGLSIVKRFPSSFGSRAKYSQRKMRILDKQKIIKINERIPVILKIHPYEVIRNYIEQATKIIVTPCPCRKVNRLLDETIDEMRKVGCRFPVEDTCLNLRYDNQAVNEYSLRGGHIISKKEALDILNRCEKAGLVHTSFNSSEKIEFICNCCPCCCGILGTMTRYHQKYRAFVESNFQPVHQKPKCVRCGKCMQICPVHAISHDKDGFPIIDVETCIGCAVCVTNCSKTALNLIKIKNQRPAIDAIEAYVNFAHQKVV